MRSRASAVKPTDDAGDGGGAAGQDGRNHDGGAAPFGTTASSGLRSDEICPGQQWTYTFDVDKDMIGAWPFHDHVRHVADSVNRGLFGGIVVLPRELFVHLPPAVELPELVHRVLKRTRPTPMPMHVAPSHDGHGHGHDHGEHGPGHPMG